jgi:hypothetical protein
LPNGTIIDKTADVVPNEADNHVYIYNNIYKDTDGSLKEIPGQMM